MDHGGRLGKWSIALLGPEVDQIGRIFRRGNALLQNGTPDKMQVRGQKKTKTAWIWTYLCDGSAFARIVPALSVVLVYSGSHKLPFG